MVFIIMMLNARRGREGFDKFLKSDFESYANDDGYRYIRFAVKRRTKSHKNDSENIEDGGSIPYEVNAYGISPADYIDELFKRLNPGNDFVMQRPSRSFDIYAKDKFEQPW